MDDAKIPIKNTIIIPQNLLERVYDVLYKNQRQLSNIVKNIYIDDASTDFANKMQSTILTRILTESRHLQVNFFLAAHWIKVIKINQFSQFTDVVLFAF